VQKAGGPADTETPSNSFNFGFSSPSAKIGDGQGPGGGFTVNQSTGEGTMTIPLKVTPGRNGIEPNLNLVYSSNGENTWCGKGWT